MQLAPTSALAGCPPSGCFPRPAASWTSRCAPRRSGSSVGMARLCDAAARPGRCAQGPDKGGGRAWGPGVGCAGPTPAGPVGRPGGQKAAGPAAPTSVCRWCSALYSFFISDSRSSSRETGKHKPPASPAHSLLLLRAGLREQRAADEPTPSALSPGAAASAATALRTRAGGLREGQWARLARASVSGQLPGAGGTHGHVELWRVWTGSKRMVCEQRLN